MGELTEAIQTLQMAMALPGVRRAGSSSKSKSKKIELSPADCVSVFLELAEALWLNGKQVWCWPFGITLVSGLEEKRFSILAYELI